MHYLQPHINMYIFIKDDEGLDSVLMMDGYSPEERHNAKQAIRVQFRETAQKVFQDILDKPLPESLTVNMAISDREEMKGEAGARLASYNVELSRAGSAFFTIREITIKTILEQTDQQLLESTVIHEMFHAADQHMLKSSHRIFEDVQDDIFEAAGNFNHEEANSHTALLMTLQVFGHYRAEGVALLGEALLMKSPFGTVTHATAQFCKTFEMTMMRAQQRIGSMKNMDIFDKDTFHKAYHIAPIILLLVLEQGEDISHELAQKTLKGLESGHYHLTDDEIATIMRSAVNLPLAGFIQGLICLGDEVAPISPFLDFCASIQKDGDDENIDSYEDLIEETVSEETFNEAMDQIMGCRIPEEELDGLYQEFMDHPLDDPSYPELKEKATSLYTILKNDTDPDRKELAQWALTYLFDEEDLIHDDIPGIGYVDDLVVIDYAIDLLETD